MLEEKDLTLDKAIAICLARESAMKGAQVEAKTLFRKCIYDKIRRRKKSSDRVTGVVGHAIEMFVLSRMPLVKIVTRKVI